MFIWPPTVPARHLVNGERVLIEHKHLKRISGVKVTEDLASYIDTRSRSLYNGNV